MPPSDEVIISVSGIRGIIGQGLTPELAARFAAALGSHVGGKRMVLSRDGRPSGGMLRHAVLAGFYSAGCEVKDIGIAPTPTCGLAVRRLEAAGGVQITASHNPAEWNGLKLFGPDGAVLTASEGRRIKELFESGPLRRVGWKQLGQVEEQLQAGDWHCERVLQLVDIARIQARRARGRSSMPMGARGSSGPATAGEISGAPPSVKAAVPTASSCIGPSR